MKKAFTIVEILIVVLILSVLSGVSFFGFNVLKNSVDLNLSARQVIADMRLTQALAKAEHYPHQVIFYRGSNTYQIVNLENGDVMKNEKVADTVRFDGKELFIFSSSGNPVVGGSGTLIISSFKGKMKKVVVAPNGRIRFE